MVVCRPHSRSIPPPFWFVRAICLTACVAMSANCEPAAGSLPYHAPPTTPRGSGPSSYGGLTPRDAEPEHVLDSGPETQVDGQVRSSFSLATFNVKNLFDDVDDDDLDDVPTSEEMQEKIKELGAALRALDADIIALQEVENRAVLTRLRDEELGDRGYSELILVEGNDPRGIDVALLSRLPVKRFISHRRDRFAGLPGDNATHSFSRDCLVATIETPRGRRLILLINHLKAASGNPRTSDAKRAAQALRVREIADEIFASGDNYVAVVGDLNAEPGSVAVDLIEKGDPVMSDLLALVPADQRYTTTWRSRKQFDYLLASPALLSTLVPDSIYVDHRSIFSDTSDHFPVIATFDIPAP